MHVLLGVLLGLFYFNLGRDQRSVNERIALMLFSMFFLALSMVLPTLVTVLPELAVVRKEYHNNWYSLGAYYSAKIVSDTPLLVLAPLVYLTLMGNLSGLTESGWRFGIVYLSMLLVAFVAHSWAMLLASFARSLAVAIFFTPVSLLPMFLFGGFFKNVQDITWAFRWLSYIDYMKYIWEILGIATFRDLALDSPLTGNVVLEERLAFRSITMGGYWASVAIVNALIALWRVLAYFGLRRRLR